MCDKSSKHFTWGEEGVKNNLKMGRIKIIKVTSKLWDGGEVEGIDK